MRRIFFVFCLLSVLSSFAQQEQTKKFYGPNAEGVYTFAEVMPEYRGGETEMMKFLKNNINDSIATLSAGTGKVLVRFVIDEKGKVGNIKVIRSASPELDKEVVRAVSKMPDFKPAMQGGKPVKVFFNLPVYIHPK